MTVSSLMNFRVASKSLCLRVLAYYCPINFLDNGRLKY